MSTRKTRAIARIRAAMAPMYTPAIRAEAVAWWSQRLDIAGLENVARAFDGLRKEFSA